MTVVENITAEHNRYVPPTATNDLKVGNIFESKVKLLQATSEWFIVRSLSFKLVKKNRTCYTTVCGANENDGGKECLWRLHASVSKNGYFKIKNFVQEHTCYMPILQSNHREAMISFVCNVIMFMVRGNIDLAVDNITEQICTKFYITIPYSKA